MSTPTTDEARLDLRPDLQHLERDGGGCALLDPDTGAMVELSATARRFVDACARGAPVEAAARDVGLARAQADAIVGALRDHLLLDEPQARVLRHRLLLHRAERARAARGQLRIVPPSSASPAAAPAARRGLRWSCLGCGACCRGRFAVQLDAADVARLRAVDLAGRLGIALDDALVWPSPSPAADARPWLRTVDGRCVFLGDDGLCNVHRAFGPRAKPAPCQAFPFEALLTPDGPLLRYRPECSGQLDSMDSGAPVDAGRAAHTWRELTASAEGVLEVPDGVALARESQVTWARYRQLESSASQLAAASGWRAALGALHDAACRAAGDAPDHLADSRAVAIVLAAARRRALDQIVSTRAASPLAELVDGVTPTPAVCASLVATVFELLRASLPGAPDWPRAGDDGPDPLRAPAPFPAVELDAVRLDRVRAAAAALVVDADGDRLLGRYLQDALFGKYLFHAETCAAGRSLVELVIACALLAAGWAHVEHGRALDGSTLNEALVVWHLQVFGHSALRVDVQLVLGSVVESVRLAETLATWLSAPRAADAPPLIPTTSS